MPTSSVVAAWELGLRLRSHREDAGLTSTVAAKAARCTQGYISDVERGGTKVAPAKLELLIELYGVPKDDADAFRELREVVSERGWWQEYTGIFDPVVLRMFGLEHGAATVRAYENLLVTGLLQTEEYAHALSYQSHIFRSADIGPRMEARMRRRRRLDGDDPLQLSVLMSEAALCQQIGGPDVLRRQLGDLAETIESHPDTVDVRIIPFTARRFGVIGASTFHLYKFASPRLPALLYQESISYAEILDRPGLIRDYDVAFMETQGIALDREASLAAIRRAETEL